MNEVIANKQVAAIAAARASSLGASGQGVATGEAGKTGKNLPPDQAQPAAQASSEPVVRDEPLDNVVAQMNEHFQMEQRDLRFNVDEESGLTIIRVVDRKTGDLIRQIPEDIFLQLARQVKEHEPIQLINVQG